MTLSRRLLKEHLRILREKTSERVLSDGNPRLWFMWRKWKRRHREGARGGGEQAQKKMEQLFTTRTAMFRSSLRSDGEGFFRVSWNWKGDLVVFFSRERGRNR